jgi:fatty-acid desaturase
LTRYELDVSWYRISALRMLGLAWDVRVRRLNSSPAEQFQIGGCLPQLA